MIQKRTRHSRVSAFTTGNPIKNLTEQTLCLIKIFISYRSQGLVQFFSPFAQEQSPFVAVSFIKRCYSETPTEIYSFRWVSAVKKVTVYEAKFVHSEKREKFRGKQISY